MYPIDSASAHEISKLDLITNSIVSKTPIVKTPTTKLSKTKLAKTKIGRLVKQGETIGYQGGVPGACGAGLTIGSHLHFEVRLNNATVNPRDYFGKTFVWPFANPRVTQEFGPADWTPWYKFHTGIDMASSVNAPVRSAAAGKVVFDGLVNGYGHLIIIQHDKSLRTYYGHLKCL